MTSLTLERSVTLRASAKINLALHITGRRPDSYHLLDSIAVFADLGDTVEIAPAARFSLRVSGPFAAHAPGDASDLAWRAAEAFYAHAGLKARAAIRVEKNIPAGAGLGGGSADAAAVLLGLNRLHKAGLLKSDLQALGLELGADVPMCLAGRALRASGIGEVIDPLHNWPALPLVLVWPGAPVSTAACFGALSCRDNPGLPPPQNAETPAAVAAWLAGARNDLEAPAQNIAPQIGEALKLLRSHPACRLARMSGSGSACFGLYDELAAARRAAADLQASRPDWWVAAATAR